MTIKDFKDKIRKGFIVAVVIIMFGALALSIITGDWASAIVSSAVIFIILPLFVMFAALIADSFIKIDEEDHNKTEDK